jgi:hypothetical protein
MTKPPFAKIKNESGYVKDMANKAILSTDLVGLEAYKTRKKKAVEMQSKLDEINTLKQDVAEIKDLLKQLLGSKE